MFIKALAFDTSLINLGVSVGDIRDDCLLVNYATTYNIDRLVGIGMYMHRDIPLNTVRCDAIYDLTEILIEHYNPDMVIYESPFYNQKNPKTLMSQMLAVAAINIKAYMSINKDINPLRYNPVELSAKEVRAAFNVKDGDKYLMEEALMRLMEEESIRFKDDAIIDKIDNHTIDSIAMLYNRYLAFKTENPQEI
jgi:Holliday junction resolvasome RuvABC endonuclease subunit